MQKRSSLEELLGVELDDRDRPGDLLVVEEARQIVIHVREDHQHGCPLGVDRS